MVRWIWYGIIGLLAIYGLAELIRRIWLRAVCCPHAVWLCRVAIPRRGQAIEPLLRCLQYQASWREEDCRCTMLILPPPDDEELAAVWRAAATGGAVCPVTAEEFERFIKTRMG